MSKQLSVRTKDKLQRLLQNTGDIALKRRARRIIEELEPQEGEKILDVGCGDGYYLYLLSNLGLNLQLTGTDFDKRALSSAKVFLKNKKIKLVYGDLMTKLPFKAGSFDKVVMSEVTEHLPDDIQGLKEVKRILRKNGILVLTVPNYNFPFLWDPINWTLQSLLGTHIKSGFWAGIWNQHLRLYKPSEIKKVCQRAGFKIKKVESLTFWSLPFNHYLVNFGARILAANKDGNVLTHGANKFSQTTKKSLLVKLFFEASNLVDGLNDIWFPSKEGVGVLLKGKKE